MAVKKMEFPKHVYRKDSEKKLPFVSAVAHSAEDLEALEDEFGEHYDSPADFGVETHPNPRERREMEAKKRAEEKARAEQSKQKSGKDK